MTPTRWSVLQAARTEARHLLRRNGVIAVGIGQRHRAGRWVPGPACIVVKVLWKLADAELRRRRQKSLPPFLSVAVDGKPYRVPIDIQETAGIAAGHCQGLVGSAVDVDGALGAISAVVLAGGVRKLLISGHVARRANRRVSFGSWTGVTQRPFMTSQLDHCVVTPDTTLPSATRTLVDDRALIGIASASDLAPEQILYFHHAATGTRIPVALRQLDMPIPFDYPGGIRTLQGLLGTDRRTVDGDSGALLFDSALRAVATLVGVFASESYFLPLETALAAMEMTLA